MIIASLFFSILDLKPSMIFLDYNPLFSLKIIKTESDLKLRLRPQIVAPYSNFVVRFLFHDIVIYE